MGRIFKALPVAAALAASVASAHAANEAQPKVEMHGDWAVRCLDRGTLPPCDIVQAATRDGGKEQVLRVSIAYAADRDQYGLQFVVPLGVLISGGVIVRVDDKPAIPSLKFTRCEISGCFIEALVEPSALKPLRDGKSGLIAVLDGKGQPLAMPLSFDGFDEAIDSMTEKTRAWAQARKGGSNG